MSAHNRDAFDKLYSRYWEDMFKTAYAILKDEQPSKDIVQDIFVWLWEHRTSLEITALKSYLKAAVKFKVANYIRAGNIRESFFSDVAKIQLPNTFQSPGEDVEIKQLKTIIYHAIEQLPEKCREIFQLSREANLSNHEIAQRLNISTKTVENQITIAIRRVRQAASPYATGSGIALIISLQEMLK